MALGGNYDTRSLFHDDTGYDTSRLTTATDQIHTQTRNWAPSRVRPDALFAATFVNEISPWRIRRSAISRGSSPTTPFDSRDCAPVARRAGVSAVSAVSGRLVIRPCLQTNAPAGTPLRCFDRMDASRRGGVMTGIFYYLDTYHYIARTLVNSVNFVINHLVPIEWKSKKNHAF